MSLPYSRAPHSEGGFGTQREALNAALLIDFDNVTMGMRSDLSKELKSLLNSDIIKGKVTVQRAYADWRRYPQYIVPLSEHSVDLIFAPAYGSSKKNATDIRMAIDAMELVFIRPEIGTFILLTGDSDFSSLVLKLKEYGKYVIGVGIQESSSDILVQNCDEYYSYTSITGLRKTTDSANKPVDPWVLVEQAVDRMASRDDVMRSDRLKQVMMEIDPSFDEGNFGFSKFSRFLSEAGNRDVVTLRKLDNGQYEVIPAGSKGRGSGGQGGGQSRDDSRKSSSRRRGSGKDQDEASSGGQSRGSGRKDDGAQGKGSGNDRGRGGPEGSDRGRGSEATPSSSESKGDEDPLKRAYQVVREAIQALAKGDGGEGSVRDSDLKRKILQIDPGFDEGELGFGKFSRFLRQAHDHEIVDLQKRDDGTYQVALRGAAPGPDAGSAPAGSPGESAAAEKDGGGADPGPRGGPEDSQQSKPKSEDGRKSEDGQKKDPQGEDRSPSEDQATGAPRPQGSLRVRRGERGRKRGETDGPPPLLEGQAVSASESGGGTPTSSRRKKERESPSSPGRESRKGSTDPLDVSALGLPTSRSALIRYLTNSYKGVGQKTAEKVVEKFGSDLFQVLHAHPERLDSVIQANRVDQLLRGWRTDLARRLERKGENGQSGDGPQPGERPGGGRRTRGGSRSRGRSGGGSS